MMSAIHSVCLSNEPLSLDGEHCPILKTQWPAWLKAKYHDIATLNHNQSISYLLNPWHRIERLLARYRNGEL